MMLDRYIYYRILEQLSSIPLNMSNNFKSYSDVTFLYQLEIHEHP